MAEKYISLDAAQVKTHIESLYAKYPDLETDEELREGVFLGETQIDQLVSRALDQMSEDGIMIDGIKSRVEALSERCKRFERRSDAMRSLIKDLMQTANLKSLPLPEATVALANGRQSVVIVDEDSVPRQLGTSTWRPDKTAIGAQLKAGEPVPGAELQTGEPTLTIRRR